MSSTGRSRCAISLLSIGIWAAGWTVHASPWQTPASRESSRHEAFGGVWSLNRDESQIPDRRNAPPRSGDGQPDGTAPPQGGDGFPGGSGGGRRGGGGFGGFGGFGGPGRPGGPGGQDDGDKEKMQAMANYMRSLMEPTGRLTIVVQPTSVVFTDADGKTMALQTNDKNVEERAENGLVKLKRKSKWDGAVLVSTIDIDNGPKVERRYELVKDEEQLRIATTVSGGLEGRGGNRGVPPVLHVYDHERPQ